MSTLDRNRSWLQDHLESFVQPYLGKIKVDELLATRVRPPFSFPISFHEVKFTPEEMSLIKSAWRAMKSIANGKTIGLYGRDVWVWEVLARRENYPTLFVPECSRQTAHLVQKKCEFLFDTGFVGSIPRALGIKNFKLFSADRIIGRGSNGAQIFPHLRGARSLALKIEETPKYWKSAINVNGEIVQNLSEIGEFTRAAALTIDVYRDSSPRTVPRASLSALGRRLM